MRPLPDVAPGAQGASVESLLSDLQQVMDGAYQPSHPGALAHLDPPPLTASIAAELVCAGLNNNLLAEELSPGLTGLEHDLCRWFCHRIGLPSGSGGVLASGGTLSNLMALVAARAALGSTHRDPVLLCSQDAHVSINKAAKVMGLADDALQTLPVAADGGLCLEALAERLRTLEAEGRPCLAVVATAGTTVRGAIDPLSDLATLCRDAEVWLHVDAAIGGVFALSSSHASLMDGMELADSITLNPQKLLGITKASSLLLLRDRTHLRQAFSTGLPYMEAPKGMDHGGEIGLQGTRPAEILKLWLGLRQLGEAGIEATLSGARCNGEPPSQPNWIQRSSRCWRVTCTCWPSIPDTGSLLQPAVGVKTPGKCCCLTATCCRDPSTAIVSASRRFLETPTPRLSTSATCRND